MAKRIGMILDTSFPPDPRVENEASILIKNGFEVYLFCLTYKNEPNEVVEDIHICRYSSNKLEYKLSALAYDFPWYHKKLAKKIERFIHEFKVDILHVHDMRIAEAVFKANKLFNLKVVLDLHDNYPEIMQFYPHMNKFPGKYLIQPSRWKSAEKKLIQKADKVITVSPQFIEDLKNRFPDASTKFRLVPNAVNSSFYENYSIDESIKKRYSNNFVLLYLGDTHIRRGLLTAIESILSLNKIIPNIKLVIVGKSSTDSILKQKVEELSILDYVDFEGWQDMSLFPSYISVASIGICPLDRNIQHDVAYANKLFQYMSFGIPVLVSNAKAQQKLILENNVGLVHQEKNHEDFAAKVLEMHLNPSLTKKMGLNAKELVRNKMNWEQTSNELITLYQELLS